MFILKPGTALNDIPQFPRAHYTINIEWRRMEAYFEGQITELGLDLDPDFQRGHVWTTAQQAAYVEYILQGGESAKTLLAGSVNWNAYPPKAYVLLDGKQRLEAVRAFMRDELKVFGLIRSQFTGTLRIHHGFLWSIIDTESRADMLRAYLNFNGGGTAHSPAELARVRAILAAE